MEKKSGTILGVFLPSMLSIVGAIMYLRLSWIVGTAGIAPSLTIVFLSFIISIITGLGLSSIATDQKQKKDGIYHLLSRSMGVPMGSTICITLLIALLFNAAIQIIGISETLLNMPKVASFLNMEPCSASYRIIGSAILLLIFLTIIIVNYTSTSKARIVVISAFLISLISIVAGIATNTDIRPEMSTAVVERDFSWTEIFGIFFPASTGFTIGLTFNSSLKNPHKSILSGTIGAIICSFAIYILTIIALDKFVCPTILTEDSVNFFPSISFSPIITYIAILISLSYIAFSIMAITPNIVASMAHDKVLPRIFDNNYDRKDKKPINATIVLFIIAECIVLIGDLNTLAYISTISLLTTYTLINLTFVLERWTNSDFKPYVRLSKYIGIIGVIICASTIYQLCEIVSIAIVIIVVTLYFTFRNNNIRIEYGDVWQNVLLSITKASLIKINKKKLENKAWQPNVIVFSGSKNKRPYLVDFGKWIIGKHGFLSVFNVSTNTKEKFFTHKNNNSIIGSPNEQWIETKFFPCEDIFTGIETVSSTYGFTGIEPNTIILGFNGTTTNRERFFSMVNNIIKLDKNLLLLHFDTDNGYGNKKTTDIWVTPEDNDTIFILNISKFLIQTPEWANCRLRINVINNNNSAFNILYCKIEDIINDLRINCEINIVNNELEHKSLKDLITSHSSDSDLLLLSIPQSDNIDKFETMNTLSEIDKSIIFVKSSKQFQTTNNIEIIASQSDVKTTEDTYDSELLPIQPEAADYFRSLEFSIQQRINETVFSRFEIVYSHFNNYINTISEIVAQKIKQPKTANELRNFSISTHRSIKQKINLLTTDTLPEINNIFQNIGDAIVEDSSSLINSIPDVFTVFYDMNVAFITKTDSKEIVAFKKRLQRYMKRNGSELYPYRVKIKQFISSEIDKMYNEIFAYIFKAYKNYCLSYYLNLNDIINTIDDSCLSYSNSYSKCQDIDSTIQNINKHIEISIDKNKEYVDELKKQIINIRNKYLITIRNYFNTLNFGSIKASKTNNLQTTLKTTNNKIELFNSLLTPLFNRTLLNIDLAIFKYKLNSYTNETSAMIVDYINNKVSQYHRLFIDKIKDNSSIDVIDTSTEYDFKTEFYSHLNEITDKLTKSIHKLPSKILIIDNQTLSKIESELSTNTHPTYFSASRFLDYTVQYYYTNKLKKIQNTINTLVDNSLDKQKDIITQLSFINEQDSQKEVLIATIEEELTNLKQQTEKSCKEIRNISITTEEKLQLDVFISSSNTLRDIISSYDKEISTQNIIKRIGKTLSTFSHKLFTNVWYRQSSSIITLQKLQDRNTNSESLKKYFDSINKLTLQPEIEQVLPYSYKQLFTISQQYNKDFWVGRNKEVEDFGILYNQYISCKQGAILVTGGMGIGKTFFSYHVARMYVPNQQIYSIKSVTGGSASISKFEASFLRSVEMQGSTLTKAIRELPKNSVIILDNIEQWWLRTENGDVVINTIIDLVNRYSSDYLFIINSNTNGYNAVRLTTNIQQIFIGSINLLPFNASELESIITRRHKAGNLKLVIDNKSEKHLRPWNYAKLFSQYHKLTNGNIKSTLNAWLSCITKVEDDTIHIHSPHRPETLPLYELSKHQIVFLAQFIIHNNMSFERISAIWNQPITELRRDINILLRLKLLERKNDNVLGINSILYPFIIDELKKLEMI